MSIVAWSTADRADQFLTLAGKYTDFSALTNQMILEFIDKIIVHAPIKVNGERERKRQRREQEKRSKSYKPFKGGSDPPFPMSAGRERRKIMHNQWNSDWEYENQAILQGWYEQRITGERPNLAVR